MGRWKIRIGVYGTSGSGKTTFWQQIIASNNVTIPAKSKLARFVETSNILKSQAIPTTTILEGIAIRIGAAEYVFQDYPGKQLSEALDRLDLLRYQVELGNLIAKQVARCDVFFFFFNPSSGYSTGAAHEHHRKELLRAKQLIDFIPVARQNRLMPILFVLQKPDKSAQSAEIAFLTKQWIDEVSEHLEQTYSGRLRGHYPASLIRKEGLFFSVPIVCDDRSDRLQIVLNASATLVDLSRQFRCRDRRKTFRFVAAFFCFVLFFVFVPLFFQDSPVAKKLFALTEKSLKHYFPFVLDSKELPEQLHHDIEKELQALLDEKRPRDSRSSKGVQQSLYRLMRSLNRLEDEGQDNSDLYREQYVLWNRTLDTVGKYFDTKSFDSPRDKLQFFSVLLDSLADSPKRCPSALDDVLKKYWFFYRQTLVAELREDISMYRAAGSPSSKLLEELTRRLDKSFRTISESKVRSNGVFAELSEQNLKEELKQEIRQAFIACKNFTDQYAVKVAILSSRYDLSPDEDAHNYHYRLMLFGGKEKGEVQVDLMLRSDFQEELSASFLPSRDTVDVPLIPDHPLLVSLERRQKGTEEDWNPIATWELSEKSDSGPSLRMLGVSFYLHFENDDNTRYKKQVDKVQFEFKVHRPRNVSVLLWEIGETN